MNDINTEKKPRAPKSDGPRSYIVTVGGKDWIIKLDAVRVASPADKDRALDGELPRAKIVDARPNTASGGGGA